MQSHKLGIPTVGDLDSTDGGEASDRGQTRQVISQGFLWLSSWQISKRSVRSSQREELEIRLGDKV